MTTVIPRMPRKSKTLKSNLHINKSKLMHSMSRLRKSWDRLTNLKLQETESNKKPKHKLKLLLNRRGRKRLKPTLLTLKKLSLSSKLRLISSTQDKLPPVLPKNKWMILLQTLQDSLKRRLPSRNKSATVRVT